MSFPCRSLVSKWFQTDINLISWQYWLTGMVLMMYVVGIYPLSQITPLWSNYHSVCSGLRGPAGSLLSHEILYHRSATPVLMPRQHLTICFKLSNTGRCQYPTLKSFQDAFVTFRCSISVELRSVGQPGLHSARRFVRGKHPFFDYMFDHFDSSIATHTHTMNKGAQICFQGCLAVQLGAMLGLDFFPAVGNQWKVTFPEESTATSDHIPLFLAAPPTSGWLLRRK